MKKSVVAISLILVALALLWFYFPLRSLVVMSYYSNDHAKQSVMRQNEFEIDIPSGRGWYPFVMTYNASGFTSFSKQGAKMSIMYNFGAFDFTKRTSSLYDKQSDKYSSFYGAYVVQEDGGVFGFDDDGSIDLSEVSLAVEYDYTKLVIRDFGCDNQTFEIGDFVIEEDVAYAGSTGWTRIDAVMVSNGAAHNYDGYMLPYLQYGRPMDTVEIDFEVT
ncbi:MAG: hypothetical protein HN948_07595, partial [Clostridia bacterium]|nr:hypothetical protein [Clostridia bacterium]